MFDENSDANEMVKSGMLSDLASNARIILCLFSSTRELSKEFMQATFTMGMNNYEYAYIIPWIQAGPKVGLFFFIYPYCESIETFCMSIGSCSFLFSYIS